MPDDEADTLPDWARDLKPPPPIDEDVRQWLIGLEIERQQTAYREANPARAAGQGKKEGERDESL